MGCLRASNLHLLSAEDLKDIKDDLLKRWRQLHTPFHAAGYLLSPKHMDDAGALKEPELMQGFKTLVTRLEPDIEKQVMVLAQLATFRRGTGYWCSPLVRASKVMDPAIFWETHGSACPDLQAFAGKVLGVTVTTCAAERNWSTYEFIHNKRR